VAEALVETGTRRPTQPDEIEDADTIVAPLPRRRAPHSTADVADRDDDEVTTESFRPLTADL
jgi:hypothetical protein